MYSWWIQKDRRNWWCATPRNSVRCALHVKLFVLNVCILFGGVTFHYYLHVCPRAVTW